MDGHAENAVVLVELHGDREGAAVVGVIGVAGGLHIGVLAAGLPLLLTKRMVAYAWPFFTVTLIAHDARAAGAAGEGEAVGRVDAVLERRAVIHAGGGAAGVGFVIGFVVRIGGVRGRRRRRGRRGCRSDRVGRVADLLERIGAERHRAVVPDVVFQAVRGDDEGLVELRHGDGVGVLAVFVHGEGRPVVLVLLGCVARTGVDVIVAGAAERQRGHNRAVHNVGASCR